MVEPIMQSFESNLSFHQRDTEAADNRGVCDTDWLSVIGVKEYGLE